MVIKYKSLCRYASQRWDDIHFTQFQSCGGNSASQSSQIVLIGIADFLNQPMLPQSFKKSRHLMTLFVFDDLTQGFVAEPADVKFTADNSTEQRKVIAVKEIEPLITAVIFFDRPGYFVQVFDSAGRVINSRDKLNVPAIRCFHQFEQHRQAVNGSFQRRIFHFPSAVPVFHPSVVFEERNIIGHSLNTKDDTKLIIHLDGNFTHPMFDTGPFDPCVKIITHFVLIAAVKFAAKECGDIPGLDRVNGCADNFIINRLKIALLVEDDISGVFDLHKTPVIAVDKVPNDRTVLPDDLIQLPMNAPDINVISEFLSLIKVVNLHKYIIKHLKNSLFPAQCRSQHVMAVTIELQSKRCPCRHSQIAQAKLSCNEIKVIVQAFAGNRLEMCFMGLFVMPGLISSAGFHRRKDMYKSWMRTSLLDNIVNAVFFPKILFANKIDFQAVFFSQHLGIKANLFSHRFNKIGVIKNSDVSFEEQSSHTLGVTDARNGSSHYDSVKTGDDAFDFRVVSLDKVLHRSDSPYKSFELELLSEKCLAA
jgi:hypothetical protein